MGNILSSTSAPVNLTENDIGESETMNDARASHDEEKESEQFFDANNQEDNRARAREKEMDEFKKQLSIKRQYRKEILARHKAEKENLEKALQNETISKLNLYNYNQKLRELLINNNIQIPEDLQSAKENSELSYTIVTMTEELNQMKSDNNKIRIELADTNLVLQKAYSDMAELHEQNFESMKQINALKEVISVTKTMINLREHQLQNLKEKLKEIETSLADRETNLLSTDLKQEYERQLQNIRTLRGLYEERARLAEVTRQGLIKDLEDQKIICEVETKKCKDLEAKVNGLDNEIQKLQDIICNKNDQISICQRETSGLRAEMAVVHKLFSQVLLGYKTRQDLDKLVNRLEENHGLLTHMAEKENGSEVSSELPKLLLELVSQVDDEEENEEQNKTTDLNDSEPCVTINDSESTNIINTTPEEIVKNLPKVWKVLMELLSHQNVPDGNTADKVTTCYKSVDTKSGPVLVPSVSQTYIRLKDLIIEKLGLIKEVNRMKQLNGHLETRLEEQEKRLCLVTTELSKTWHVVGRLRKHHYQLHTHEKILKYELQQKRKLLNELKEELEYCREKWEQAREKNTQSEKDWRKLRAEFSDRTAVSSPSYNNSGESGFSDERQSDESFESNDDCECTDGPVTRCKKKTKKYIETILDTSTDINLTAEREDPMSDMLDVADLPLDAQEVDDNKETNSHSSNVENNSISEVSDEIEGEIEDFQDDKCTNPAVIICERKSSDPISKAEDPKNLCDTQTQPINSIVPHAITTIDPADILKNIREQKERLAKKDEKLENLEKNSKLLLKKTKATVEFSDQINSTLDHIINRPSTSRNCEKTDNVSMGEILSINDQNDSNMTQKNALIWESSGAFQDSQYSFESTPGQTMHPDTIESDKSIIKLENSCSKKINDKIASSSENKNEVRNTSIQSPPGYVEIVEKCSTIEIENTTRTDITSEIDPNPNHSNCVLENETDACTSNDNGHEARFAARDIRLKRLEEQTKSLVSKVNDTNNKGVKIHYKLEELHNIYGSESSRAGTPAEDTEDKSIEDDAVDE